MSRNHQNHLTRRLWANNIRQVPLNSGYGPQNDAHREEKDRNPVKYLMMAENKSGI